jgi:hypothetical protein
MSKYHESTLKLLEIDSASDPTLSRTLEEWGIENDIILPAAFLEWAQLGGGEILETYSNTDRFYFGRPEIVTIADGRRGLLFHVESQGNFQMIVALDEGDDPPVLYSWLGDPPWVQYTRRFSDFVFTQVFDFEYRVREDGFFNDFMLRSNGCIETLRERFEEKVPSVFLVDDEVIRASRFMRDRNERVTLLVWPTGKTAVCVTGSMKSVVAMENELLEMFGDHAEPLEFSIVNVMAGEFDRLIQIGCPAQIKYGCVEKPTDVAIRRLIECHRSMLFRQRVERMGFREFPNIDDECRVGGPDWGVEIVLKRKNENWWILQAISATEETEC